MVPRVTLGAVSSVTPISLSHCSGHSRPCARAQDGEEGAVLGLRSLRGQLRQEPPPWAWSLNLGKTVLPVPSPCSSKSWEEER